MKDNKAKYTILALLMIVIVLTIAFGALVLKQNEKTIQHEFSFAECVPESFNSNWTSAEVDGFEYKLNLALNENNLFSLEEVDIATGKIVTNYGKWQLNEDNKSIMLTFEELDERWYRILSQDLSIYEYVLSYDATKKYIEIQFQYFVGDQVEKTCKEERFYINIFGIRLYKNASN